MRTHVYSKIIHRINFIIYYGNTQSAEVAKISKRDLAIIRNFPRPTTPFEGYF